MREDYVYVVHFEALIFVGEKITTNLLIHHKLRKERIKKIAKEGM